ncbi:MAG: hypothetical protein M3Y87_11295 [Myxococcota bacterium]|nr:hypothetical protein [Myxococcota bacterium]
MGGFERRGTGWPDRRPPPPVPPARDGICVKCGEAVALDERDRGEPVRHLVCDVVVRRGLLRRIEASRAIHRAIAALASVPILRTRLVADIAALPDACDVADAMLFLGRARTVVECSAELTPHQRRVALSFVDSTARTLGA